MNRMFAFLIFSAAFFNISAQDTINCNPDTTFINSGALVDPAPYINDTLGEGLPDGCINTPYDLTIFVNPPNTFEFNGFAVGVDSFTIDSLVNLPDGLSYTCSTGN